ncbi:hypothetical protein LIER_21781 [Lithospermum erythrorhizon]|uniref:F-box associated beta-propeller type 1 domain-containing protein n=1 Tax=Lithospermum erythrorhizon TaxID=34254 RepID=A0AAV3QX71_LITER
MRYKIYFNDKWVCSPLALTDIHNNLFCLDDTKTNKKLKKLTLNGTRFTQYIPELLFSFGGLVAFKCRASLYFVLNPISGKSRCIPWPPTVPYVKGAYMCGMFFHPLASEFKLIFVHRDEYTEESYCWYYVYGSATNCWRRINTTPLFFWPTYRYDPVVVDMRLYWMVNLDRFTPIPNGSDDPCMHAVMVFDINSEELHTMPHPMLYLCHINNFRDNHEMMILFEMDKKLWLAQIIQQGGSGMDIWELNDHVNWSWVRRYNICKSEIPKRHFIDSYMSKNFYTRRTKFFCINKGMLLINWCSAELYLLDLSRKIIRKIPDKYTSSNHRGFYLCATYTCSLLIPNV